MKWLQCVSLLPPWPDWVHFGCSGLICEIVTKAIEMNNPSCSTYQKSLNQWLIKTLRKMITKYEASSSSDALENITDCKRALAQLEAERD